MSTIQYDRESKKKLAYKFFLLSTILDDDKRLGLLADNFEREVLEIGLHFSILESPTDETLRVENAVEKGTRSASRPPLDHPAKTYVLCGFIATWFLAASPIKRSLSEKATYEGVVRLPWSLAMISTRSFCQTPTHLIEYINFQKKKKPRMELNTLTSKSSRDRYQ